MLASLCLSGSMTVPKRCDVIAVRLLPIAVLQPILSHLLSVSCHLIAPYVRPFSFQNDGAVVTRGARYCDVECAAMLTQCLFRFS